MKAPASKAAFLRWRPFLKGVGRIKGKATAYVCVDYACELPSNDPRTFQDILDAKAAEPSRKGP